MKDETIEIHFEDWNGVHTTHKIYKDVADKAGLKDGDAFKITETEKGFSMSPVDPEFDRQMEVAKKLMEEHKDVLRELAKY